MLLKGKRCGRWKEEEGKRSEKNERKLNNFIGLGPG